MCAFAAFRRSLPLLCPVFLLILISGCASQTVAPGREWVRPVYREQIAEWQARIEREGWSENEVHLVLSDFRDLVTYQAGDRLHWDTPSEFRAKGFSGDCKGITTFMMGTLKLLGYPYRVRILVVHGLLEEHALLKVEAPEGGWKIYDVVPRTVVVEKRMNLLRPVVEFDEKNAYWYPSKISAWVRASVQSFAFVPDRGMP